jgi:hypothetical protein
MTPARSTKPPRLSVQVDKKLLQRIRKHHLAELEGGRTFLSISDVLRELIDAGLRTQEASGTNAVTPEAARSAGGA